MNYLSVRQALPVGDIILVNIIQNFKHIGVSIQIYVQEAWGGGGGQNYFISWHPDSKIAKCKLKEKIKISNFKAENFTEWE